MKIKNYLTMIFSVINIILFNFMIFVLPSVFMFPKTMGDLPVLSKVVLILINYQIKYGVFLVILLSSLVILIEIYFKDTLKKTIFNLSVSWILLILVFIEIIGVLLPFKVYINKM